MINGNILLGENKVHQYSQFNMINNISIFQRVVYNLVS